jgi:hypothetical protein
LLWLYFDLAKTGPLILEAPEAGPPRHTPSRKLYRTIVTALDAILVTGIDISRIAVTIQNASYPN